MLRTAFYFIPSAMTGFIVSGFPFRNRVSLKEAFEGLELGEGKRSRPVLRGPGGRKAAWLLGNVAWLPGAGAYLLECHFRIAYELSIRPECESANGTSYTCSDRCIARSILLRTRAQLGHNSGMAQPAGNN